MTSYCDGGTMNCGCAECVLIEARDYIKELHAGGWTPDEVYSCVLAAFSQHHVDDPALRNMVQAEMSSLDRAAPSGRPLLKEDV